MKAFTWGVPCSALVGFATIGFMACAENDVSSSTEPDAAPAVIPTPEAGPVDAGPEGGSCGDASDLDGCVVTTDCTTVDFCADSFPVSRQVALNAIWGSGADDVWAVGTRGAILHSDGTGFTRVASGTTDMYYAVWGTGKDDVWIVDATKPLHSTGLKDGTATFTAQKGSTFTAGTQRIWGGFSAGSSPWIVGDYSSKFGAPASGLWRLGDDGKGGVAWKGATACPVGQYCYPSAKAVWGTDADNVWAVGDLGKGYRLDDVTAGRWTQLDTRTNASLTAIWGSGPNDVWAVGEGGAILHATSKTDPWTVVPSPTTALLRAVWGSGPTDIWAVGDNGTVIHYDGTAWSVGTIGLEPGDPVTDLLGVWGSGPDDVWIVGEGVILHRTATSKRHS